MASFRSVSVGMDETDGMRTATGNGWWERRHGPPGVKEGLPSWEGSVGMEIFWSCHELEVRGSRQWLPVDTRAWPPSRGGEGMGVVSSWACNVPEARGGRDRLPAEAVGLASLEGMSRRGPA